MMRQNMADAVIERLTEVSVQAAEQIGGLMTQLTTSAEMLTPERLGRVLAMPGGVYVARVDGRIVGTVQRVDVSHSVRTKCWIEDFVVDQAYRGQGIATRLLEVAIAEAPAEAGSINLTSKPARGSSHRVYAKLGFKVREGSGLWRLGL